jgi:CubicO group peptidase (beta-lactamase class C family)
MHWFYSLIIDKGKYYGSKTKNWQHLNKLYIEGLGFGGGFANAKGLAKLMISLMNEDIIKKETLNQSFEIQNYKHDKTGKMALGWWHGKVKDNQSFYHPGGGGGYSCELRIYPEKGIVRVMMMNKTQSFKDLKLFKRIDELWIN